LESEIDVAEATLLLGIFRFLSQHFIFFEQRVNVVLY
jgi:hypothetical protein